MKSENGEPRSVLRNASLLILSISLALSLAGCAPGALLSAAATPAPGACADPAAILRAFYSLHDQNRYDDSLAYLSYDATLLTWAEGANGHHMVVNALVGKDEIRPALVKPGLRHTSGQPGDPVFREEDLKTSGDLVTFMLRPDRLRPNGRQYNPYKVEAFFNNCKIISLTVIEYVTWL